MKMEKLFVASKRGYTHRTLRLMFDEKAQKILVLKIKLM